MEVKVISTVCPINHVGPNINDALHILRICPVRFILVILAIAMAAFAGFVFIGMPLGILTSVIGLTGRWSIKVFPYIGAIIAVGALVYFDLMKKG